jgi:predicted MPP superfamily phosphohydrolase
MRRWLVLFLLLGFGAAMSAQELKLPLTEGSLRFAVIGDTGTGESKQIDVAKQLTLFHGKFPFELAIMLGDNLYGKERPSDYENKFERPYKQLLDAGVKFYAALGNHDEPNQRFYKLFNMNGERYYTFKTKEGVRFFALDSNVMDQQQLEWLEKELATSTSDWKICFFHHPPYSSGERHGSNVNLREQLEPLFLKYGVSVVFTGHEHFYERTKPQHGITYFIAGSSAKLRRGGIAASPLMAKGFDEGYTFMLVEIVDDVMHFQTISDKGVTVDSGTTRRVEAPERPEPTATSGTDAQTPSREN